MASPTLDELSTTNSHILIAPELLRTHSEDEEDLDVDASEGDTASQRSISLSSPSHSRTTSIHLDDDNHSNIPADTSITPLSLIRQGLSNRDSHPYTLDTDFSSEHDADDRSSFMRRFDETESPLSSVAPSVLEVEKEALATSEQEGAEIQGQETQSISHYIDKGLPSPTSANTLGGVRHTPLTPPSYPPPPLQNPDPRESIASFSSASTSYSKKVRPESMLVNHDGQLVLGIALVDFNHLVGPKIEFSRGNLFDDDEISKILPFLALPDGAHLTTEDYSYFHLVSPSPNPTTVFGISCNRQIRTSDLLVKEQDMTRSTVQKAVVVLASKPVFGPIRDRLGVVTRALFAQRDFTDMTILEDFQSSLELGLRSQLTESGLYMGTSLRELVHTFRQRTLILLKALMLQKKIMFYGHPVEKLCTYQYSLITLVPGLLQNLDDCGSPPLASRAQSLSRPSELRTSDAKSVMAYIGLPLDLFGKDAFFQPYLPLQQLDMLKDTRSWLCGSTNSIVTQQKEIDLLVNVETGAFEFRDPALERSAGLTPADRKWMDDVVKDVNDGWNEDDPTGTPTIQFKGSDDYLRQKFDEYISGALASVKYSSFIVKGQNNAVVITDGAGNPNAVQDFNMLWISEFKKTNAYDVWERVTDPLLFDIVEPRHPCSERPSVMADIGLRLTEGIQELKIDQQLAPTREAISRTLNAGSVGFFKAVEGVRGRWMSRNPSSLGQIQGGTSSASSSLVDVSKSDTASIRSGHLSTSSSLVATPEASPQPPTSLPNGMRPLSLAIRSPPQTTAPPPPPLPDAKATLSTWGAGIGSFFSQRASRLSMPRQQSTPPREASPAPSVASGKSRTGSLAVPTDLGVEELQPRNLDEIYHHPAPTASEASHYGIVEHHRSHSHDSDDDPAGTGVAL